MWIPSEKRGDWFVPGTELKVCARYLDQRKPMHQVLCSLQGQLCYNDHSWVPHPVVGLMNTWVAMCWICATVATQTWWYCCVWYCNNEIASPDATVDDSYRMVVRTPCCLTDCHKACRDQLFQGRQCALWHVAFTTDEKTKDNLLMNVPEYIFMRREKTQNNIHGMYSCVRVIVVVTLGVCFSIVLVCPLCGCPRCLYFCFYVVFVHAL